MILPPFLQTNKTDVDFCINLSEKKSARRFLRANLANCRWEWYNFQKCRKGVNYVKSRLLAVAAVLVAAVLLFPVPLRYKDGGTVEYKAILYSVQDVHRLNPDINAPEEFIEGTIVEIFGIEIFNNVEEP